MDDGSTDGTAEIITKYEQHLAWRVKQPNQGLYGALNTGFARATGEILGWLNANDKLHTNALFVVGSVFAAFAEVEWITGRPTVFNGGWRFHPDSLSHGDVVRYDLNCEEILENELRHTEGYAGQKISSGWIGRSGACRSCEESGNGWWSTICADVFTGCQVRIGRR